MAEYMLMVLEDEVAHAAQSPKAMSELIDRRAQFADGLRRAGQLRDSGRFRPGTEGKRVGRDGDRLDVQDGSLADDGRVVGGYYWVEAGSVDEAAQLATGCPVLASDEVAVRPLIKGVVEADKEAKPGKIFGFVVRGTAVSEDAWVDVMDRIDVETRGSTPAGSFLGGVRLQPPTSGRRVATRGERRAMFDGPFLESKEVIGGLFLLRMTSLDDAVQWAGETRFVVHGTLEIRELWRS
jgi:hypothetical protein